MMRPQKRKRPKKKLKRLSTEKLTRKKWKNKFKKRQKIKLIRAKLIRFWRLKRLLKLRIRQKNRRLLILGSQRSLLCLSSIGMMG
jgi:hypothetical protein